MTITLAIWLFFWLFRYDGNLDIEIDEEDLKLDLSLVLQLSFGIFSLSFQCKKWNMQHPMAILESHFLDKPQMCVYRYIVCISPDYIYIYIFIYVYVVSICTSDCDCAFELVMCEKFGICSHFSMLCDILYGRIRVVFFFFFQGGFLAFQLTLHH